MRANCEVRIPDASLYLPELWSQGDPVCDKPSVGTITVHNMGDPREVHVCVDHYDRWMAAGDE
jgi:hypothetical protein